jgi:hypothetical protein
MATVARCFAALLVAEQVSCLDGRTRLPSVRQRLPSENHETSRHGFGVSSAATLRFQAGNIRAKT